MNGSELGGWGERLVAAHLQDRGWTILHRNFRSGRKEIDLIALRDGVVAFVEVRTRRRADYGHPFETIGPRKRAALREAAAAWLATHGEDGYAYQFDVAAVLPGTATPAEIEYVENAWA